MDKLEDVVRAAARTAVGLVAEIIVDLVGEVAVDLVDEVVVDLAGEVVVGLAAEEVVEEGAANEGVVHIVGLVVLALARNSRSVNLQLMGFHP